jgi:tripartite-type tricarboxylate transporter receptor subunit TctC
MLGTLPALGMAVIDAFAQSYPSRPVRMVVAVAPGGNLDLVGRAVAQSLGETLGRPVIVENRPGAGGAIGMDHVARSPADGHTLVMVAPSFLIGPQTVAKPLYDPTRDFVGVSKVAVLPQMLVVHPSLPARTVAEFITFAKARPGELNYATSNTGSGSHMAMELFMRQTGLRLTRIPYKGDGPALVDLIGGQVTVKFDNLSTAIPHVRSGRLRPLGVTSPKRTPLLDGVPAIGETVPGFEASIFNGVAVAAGTPQDILARLNEAVVRFVEAPQNRSRFAQQGVELQGSASAQEFTAFLHSEYARWGKVIRDAGISAE